MKRKQKTILFMAAIVFLLIPAVAISASSGQVVVYTALDQIFSEPILKRFEKESGIAVKAVYDIEATKTTGLVNRLIAEKKNPQCDVFWNNEIIRSIILKRKGVLTPYHSPSAEDIPGQFKDKEGYWTGFAARARVLVVNTSALTAKEQPSSILQLTNPEWKGKVAIANPLFGTTATHVAALFSLWGQEKAKGYFMELKANRIKIVDGNSVVKDQVGSGEIVAGFTDTDDVNTGVLAGLPIKAIYPDKDGLGTLLIPNTVGLVANCPHPAKARKLMDYLLSRDVEKDLAYCPSAQMPVREQVETPANFVSVDQVKTMPVDFEKMADEMEVSVKFVQQLFIR
ncbi:iron transporter [Desulfosarcina alkanivorans]|uniref:Iron transporter n=1 Tax=Desulfosarcina alkanivorans TaxID=571177 RepID=A0A5K7YNW7_9BACT|nr:extracellular solute-binding protein [Desulfosarcina alkanivorans]BBO68611.1 iron transporter [Desulfosarcina alkanivorans]